MRAGRNASLRADCVLCNSVHSQTCYLGRRVRSSDAFGCFCFLYRLRQCHNNVCTLLTLLLFRSCGPPLSLWFVRRRVVACCGRFVGVVVQTTGSLCCTIWSIICIIGLVSKCEACVYARGAGRDARIDAMRTRALRENGDVDCVAAATKTTRRTLGFCD